MYNDMYKDFSDQEFTYSYPYSFAQQNKDYLQDKYAPKKQWNQGESVTISFALDESKIAEGRTVKLYFYNFRYEQIYTGEITELSTTLSFSISTEISESVFFRGVYYMKADLYEGDTKIETLINPQDYELYVK